MEGSVNTDTKANTFESMLNHLSDEELAKLTFAFPWQYSAESTSTDPDFPNRERALSLSREEINLNRSELQQLCWKKSIENPQINTSVRGTVGRINGFDFSVSCPIPEIQEVIDEIELDPRNRLYLYYPKYTGRALIEGELFLCFTVHEDGFIEIDFIDPGNVQGGTDDGIIFHPDKTNLPLVYMIDTGNTQKHIPSIFVARYPEWLNSIKNASDYNASFLDGSRNSNPKFKPFGGFNQFVVAWDRSFITKRNVSHLRTTVKWLGYYENLKEYEIDHKKSSGAYVWVVEITDPKAFRTWISLSDDQRRATGIAAKKTPGSTIVLPPGMQIKAINPNLPKITETDTDVLGMAISGLNEPSDITMGVATSPYASVKASRGPMSDRMSDEICYYEKFLRYDFWGSVFFLRSKVTSFPTTFKVREAVGFKPSKNKETDEDDSEPIFAYVKKAPERIIEINFPSSEVIDAESRARAFLGVKHGSTFDTLGIPNKEIAKKLGFGNYYQLRLEHATEKSTYPTLIQTIDQESWQERTEAEPKVSKVKKGGSDGGKKEEEQETEGKTKGKER